MRMLLALILIATAPATAPAPDGMRALQALDARVADVGFRLATANVALCARREALAGFSLHSLGQYPVADRVAAARAFGFAGVPLFLAVAKNGPAARAGVQVGDHLLAVGDAPMQETLTRKPDSTAINTAMDTITRSLALGPVKLTVRRGGMVRTVVLTGQQGCTSTIEMIPSRKRSAVGDGDVVQLTSGIVLATRDDDELAFVIAHELAHNISGHYDWLRANGRTKANIRKTEAEADAIGVKLMAGAGYDPYAAARFWSHFGGGLRGSLLSDGTHMKQRERIAFLRAAAEKAVRPIAQ